MSRSRDHALRSALGVAEFDASCATFEAVMLLRVAGPPTGALGPIRTVRRPESLTPGLLAEFDSAAAAERLAAAIAYIAPVARVESRFHGQRHRYGIHRVSVPPEAAPVVQSALDRAGSAGSAVLCAETSALPRLSPRQHRHRRALATAAWRAALLASGPGRGSDRLSVRVGDPATTRVLVRAAALLEIGVSAVLRPGGHLICVSGHEVTTLVDAVTGVRRVPMTVHASMAG